ncbi:MAG: PD-(D/E)XK nuclease family protein [Actinobacteria bacterium]|nr:PD-(D/E)XK nuclease family protein [Actinomycetota bacterium]MCA1806330.1 PD-(D/E)XK nuclease family protein [Actinomycetota bacterium]
MPQNVHTSDRINFKRCRRKWDMTSPLRQNLRSKSEASMPLWFGSGVHYALEDYHGYNRFGSPVEALRAYHKAFVKGQLSMPEDAEATIEDLGVNMMEYYLEWEERSSQFRTLWVDGVPQVEVTFEYPLEDFEGDVRYKGTLDRVMLDKFDRLWVRDYKTAAQFDTNKLELDPQVTAYLLFANQIYDAEFEGMAYLQLKKSYPKPPKPLATGGLSMNKAQSTTSQAYIKALKQMYGGKVPVKYIDFVKEMQQREKSDGDKFILSTYVRRSDAALNTEFFRIHEELGDMLNPDLPLYPNPTRDCFWDCPVRTVCIAMDDGGDYEQLLTENYIPKPEEAKWRDFLTYPE